MVYQWLEWCDAWFHWEFSHAPWKPHSALLLYTNVTESEYEKKYLHIRCRTLYNKMHGNAYHWSVLLKKQLCYLPNDLDTNGICVPLCYIHN